LSAASLTSKSTVILTLNAFFPDFKTLFALGNGLNVEEDTKRDKEANKHHTKNMDSCNLLAPADNRLKQAILEFPLNQ
jgi:hypothetical protein